MTAVEFLEGENVIGTATEAPYSLTLSGLSPGKRDFRARALASGGRSSFSPPVKCQVVGAFRSGVNLNGGEVNLDGQTLQSTADAQAAGMVLTNFNNFQTDPDLPLYPLADAATKALVTGQIRRTTTSDLGIAYPLANGTYDVFLSVIEGEQDYARDMRVRIEGATVAKGIGYLALGEWVNYGPYRTQVADGILNISIGRETLISQNPASPEPPKIAGFSIYETTPDPDLESAVLEIGQAPGLALLSWPRGVSKDRVEASFALGEDQDWQPLQLPAQDFNENQQIAVPTSHPRRFFRLRKD